jgi:hypothetical protein
MVLLLVGCVHPLGIDDETWKTMTPEQRIEASRRQAELNAAVAKAREERIKAAQAEEDIKLRELYSGRMSTSYFVPPIASVAPVPYVPVPQGGQPNLIHVMITDGSAEISKKFYPLRVAPFVMAPCEVKEIGVYADSWNEYKVMVGYIPPTLYWDVIPPRDKEGLQRYVACDADQIMKGILSTRPAIIPVTNTPVRIDRHKGHKVTVSGLTVTFINANSPLPLAR